jgi:hypothetical protein
MPNLYVLDSLEEWKWLKINIQEKLLLSIGVLSDMTDLYYNLEHLIDALLLWLPL